MYTEEEVLTTLQNALDFYDEKNELFKHYCWFVESLTKKKVGVKEGRVYLK